MNRMPPMALLAGGLATRMRPLTERVPKSMLEVAGEPFIAHQLRLIRREGITRVVLCVGHLWEQIAAFVGAGENFGLEIVYSIDGETLLGTGGAIRNALTHLGDEFLIMYGDSWLDTSYGPIVEAFRAIGRPALMTVYRNANRWGRSNVWFENQSIRCYDKHTHRDEMLHIDWGLNVASPGIFTGQPLDQYLDLADIFRAMAEEHRLAGYEIGTRFYEIGSVEGIKELDSILSRCN